MQLAGVNFWYRFLCFSFPSLLAYDHISFFYCLVTAIAIILWQITSMNFIKRLTEDYREYIDLIQPIQVAVYEMKLGLAIALSGSLQRDYLKKIKEENIEKVLVCIVCSCI